ncbi:MAG: cell envelope integrity protein CreD [Cytophagaceae bacterium]|nr:cell envelope integrity protein CreD [Cytophagaceae bacterium]
MQTTDSQSLSVWERINLWVTRSVTLKLFIIGFLALCLLIPANLVQSLITERESTRDQATAEISGKWGAAQTVGGPVLTVPYLRTVTDEKGKTSTETAYAHLLPETLNVSGSVVPEKRYRGIYVVMLYQARLRLNGTFARPDFTKLGVAESALRWNEAFVNLGVSDMRGIRETVSLTWNGRPLAPSPGIVSNDLFAAGISAPAVVPPTGAGVLRFTANLVLNGSSELRFLPFGKETTVTLTSKWGSPSFTGAFLPDRRTVTEEGFSASWKVLHYNRNYPQQGLGAFLPKKSATEYQGQVVMEPRDETGTFGVRLLLPVDEYQKTTRSAKYASLFILLTFASFFFVEILSGRRLHPIQYLLVGFAVCLFYVLLLSISEQISFHWAYLIGCAMILSMVFLYTKSIFRSLRITLIFNGILALMYGFFYSLLQLEDYSLLLGSLGLALILGVVMYLTRRIDWYNAYDKAEVNA